MANVRVVPPADGLHPSLEVRGRTYTCAAGAFLDVPDFDAQVLSANGWTIQAAGVGATAGRPTNPKKNDTFHDTTLGVTIVFDGKAWHNPATGAVV